MVTVNPVMIGHRPVGGQSPCLVIAEAGVNHNGDLGIAKRLVDAAADAGADAVKFQSFNAELVAGSAAPKADYQLRTTDVNESQVDMLRRLELSSHDHDAVLAYCRDRGILFLSTPFDEESVSLLEDLGVPAFKVASGDITNWPLLARIAKTGKPILLSTGMSYLSEVEEAMREIRRQGDSQVVLLHCVSNYPADPSDANLLSICTMAAAFRVPVGYSDHTPGVEVSLAAVVLGACVLEKHITLDRNMAGPDHASSLEPHEFRTLVKQIRSVERALGDGIKRPATSEQSGRLAGRRSVVAAGTIEPGTTVTRSMLSVKRPGTGISPRHLDLIVGCTATVRIPTDTQITFAMVR